MQQPTPDQIITAKAQALSKFGRDEVLLVTLRAPIDLVVGVAPLDLKAYSAQVDRQSRDLESNRRAMVVARAVYPSLAELVPALDRRAAATAKIAAKLYLRAGQSPELPTVRLLADVVAESAADPDAAALAVLAPKLAEVIPGLSRAKAAELLAADAAGELWAVTGPGPLSLVMRSPDPAVYVAAQAAEARAREKNEGIVAAKLTFARELVVWSWTGLDLFLDDKPAHALDIRKAMDLVAGEGADTDSKSV